MQATTRRILETSIVTGKDESRGKFRERATFQFDEAAFEKQTRPCCGSRARTRFFVKRFVRSKLLVAGGFGRFGRRSSDFRAEFDRVLLACDEDGRQRLGAVAFRFGGVTAAGRSVGNGSDLCRGGSNGVIALANVQLNVRAGAGPFEIVLAGSDCFAVELDVLVDLHRGFFSCEGSRSQEERSTKQKTFGNVLGVHKNPFESREDFLRCSLNAAEEARLRYAKFDAMRRAVLPCFGAKSEVTLQ